MGTKSLIVAVIVCYCVVGLLSQEMDLMEGSGNTIPRGVTQPVKSPSDYRLTFHQPSNCRPSSCTMFVGIDTNAGDPDYLDIYMEGKSQGWLAVGFTKTANMFSADVIACNLNPNESSKVEVLDAWNPDPPSRHNTVDKVQQSYLFVSTNKDGRISCTCGRSINGSGNNQSFDLDSDFYILLGRAIKDPLPGKLVPHVKNSPDPPIVKSLVNPAQTNGSYGVGFSTFESVSIRVHGIVMLIAWGLLASTGIFFAAFMHPALPNGQWFQAHRALMIIALLLTVAGFVLIFVAQIDNPKPGLIHLGTEGALIRVRTAHFAIGILVMFLQLINPIIAIFRCNPGDKNRWIFKYIHGIGIGLTAAILAYANMGTGLTIFSTGFSRFSDLTILWVFIGYVVLLVVVKVGTYIYSSWMASKDQSSGAIINAEKDEGTSLLQNKETKKPAADSKWRWFLFGTYTTVNVAFTVALIVLVAMPQ